MDCRAFDDQGSDTKCRKKDLSLENNEQPPEKTEVEVAEEATEPAQEEFSSGLMMESTFDEEAAGFKFSEGSYKQYRDIHAIYSDTKKTEGNRRYLRFRAKNVVKGDTLAMNVSSLSHRCWRTYLRMEMERLGLMRRMNL